MEFDLKSFPQELETALASKTLPDDILKGHHYLIEGDYFDGVTIFKSLIPSRHAQVTIFSCGGIKWISLFFQSGTK